MNLYTQQASSSPRQLSLIREEAGQVQFKNETASTEETPSSSDMDDVLLLGHQDSVGLLAALPAEQRELSAMALDEFPAAKLLSSRNINNSIDFFLDSGIAGAAEGESPPPWLWEAYRQASVAAVDSLLKEQQSQQRLLIEQQRQIEQMKLQILQERMLRQQSSSGSATASLDFHPQFHHQFQGSSIQQPDQEQAPPLFWPAPSAPSSSSSQHLETQTGTQIASPSLSSTTPPPRTGKYRRHDGMARQHGVARRASQGASISGTLKGSAMMARSKSAVNSPSIGSRSALDKASSSPRAVHTLAKALGGPSTPFSQINHLDLLQGLNSPTSTPNTESASVSDAGAMMMEPDYDITDVDLMALLSEGTPFDFSGHKVGIHHWNGRSHSPTGSSSSRSPSPSASPSLSPTPSLTKSSSSSTPGALLSSSSSALSSFTNDATDQNNDGSNPVLPVLCPVPNCNKSFARPINLTAHLKTHESPKPFACHMCERVFSRKHDLQRHIRVHTGSKPYVCLNMTCQKAFARTDALCRHYKVEEQCRRVVIQIQILENECRERERAKKEQLNVLFASGQSSGQETKEARGHGSLRKWQQFLVQQLMQQESAALEKARMLQIHQSQQSQSQQQQPQQQQHHPQQQQQQQQQFVQE
ncbi:hypothetical protein BG005_002948 [Podila minutissima]|nr:hypothetical protein BG005_002948 [Podila minutissima]